MKDKTKEAYGALNEVKEPRRLDLVIKLGE
jgi:hypothetical protein